MSLTASCNACRGPSGFTPMSSHRPEAPTTCPPVPVLGMKVFARPGWWDRGWAREFYDQKTTAGRRPPRPELRRPCAPSATAGWKTLWHCLTKNQLYDETVHATNRNRAHGRKTAGHRCFRRGRSPQRRGRHTGATAQSHPHSRPIPPDSVGFRLLLLPAELLLQLRPRLRVLGLTHRLIRSFWPFGEFANLVNFLPNLPMTVLPLGWSPGSLLASGQPTRCYGDERAQAVNEAIGLHRRG